MMAGFATYISGLLIKRLHGELDDVEKKDLEAWLNLSETNRVIADEFLNEEKLRTGIAEMYLLEERIWGRLEVAISSASKQETASFARMTPNRTVWTRVAAAAVILILLSIGGYIYFNQQRSPGADSISGMQAPLSDIAAPTSTKARITLANGRTVSLDSLPSGILASQGSVRVIKNADGTITYDAPTSFLSSALSPVFNTLTNPRGSTVIDIILTDGSRVWLNAGSSVTYPVAFVGKQRKVSITGEAYFEIAHNKAMPFVVEQNEVSVQVLGTHFNINSYDDEAAIKVTLLEGSVKVMSLRNSQVDNSIIIKPGQQASVVGNELSVVRDVDIDETMAWKNGLFSFNKVDLQTVLRQLTKWYDVDVEYQGMIPKQTFAGDIERTLSLAQVLKVLEKSEVHLKIAGKKIIVLP